MSDAKLLVILPVDGSEHSTRAFDWYLKYQYDGKSTIGILHAVDLSHAIIKIPLGSELPPGAVEDIIKKAWEAVDNLIVVYKKKCEAAGAKYEVFVETEGRAPGEIICKVAEEKNAVMIVMGSRGMGVVRRTLLGSVSDYVVHHAHIPVIIVPAPKSD